MRRISKDFGIKLEGWLEEAQKACRWFGRVEEGAEGFIYAEMA